MSKHRELPAWRQGRSWRTVPADCASTGEWIEAFLDGEVNAVTRRRIEAHLSTCGGCRAELALARRIQGGLRGLPRLTCPERVPIPHLARQVPATVTPQWLARGLAAVNAIPGFWPALAATLLLVLSAFLFHVAKSPTRPSAMSVASVALAPATPAEVARAEADVKLALSYLGRISQTAQETVSQEVLGARVAAPLAHSLRQVVTPAKGGSHAS